MRIAVIQMNAEPDVEANLARIRKYIASGANGGAPRGVPRGCDVPLR